VTGPFHEFLLVEAPESARDEYVAFIRSPRAIRIPDDLIAYLDDSLQWIESRLPDGRGWRPYMGLNHYGPTVLEYRATQKLSVILRAWITLFREAPDTLRLTGYYLPEESAYETFSFERAAIVSLFEELADLAANVREGQCILHLGI
jgi:hypothetical protein